MTFVTDGHASAIMVAVPNSGVSRCRESRNSRLFEAATKLIRWPKTFFASAAFNVDGSSFSIRSQAITLRIPSVSRGSPPCPSILRDFPPEFPRQSHLSAVSSSPSASSVEQSRSNATSPSGRSAAALSSRNSASSSRLYPMSGSMGLIHEAMFDICFPGHVVIRVLDRRPKQRLGLAMGLFSGVTAQPQRKHSSTLGASAKARLHRTSSTWADPHRIRRQWGHCR